jgi:ankyrin repeat protein
MDKREVLNGRLMKAAGLGDGSALARALEGGADALRGESEALVVAAERGHVECVRLLLPVSDALANDSCALRASARVGNANCVALLLPASDPLAKNSEALWWAAAHGHAECVRLLLPLSDPLALGEDGLDAAGWARGGGHVEVAGMIEAFIESQALSGCVEAVKKNPRAKSGL